MKEQRRVTEGQHNFARSKTKICEFGFEVNKIHEENESKRWDREKERALYC